MKGFILNLYHYHTTYVCASSGARFSKSPKLVGPISGATISYVSVKTKTFPGIKFCNKFAFSYLKNIVKDQLFRISGSQF